MTERETQLEAALVSNAAIRVQAEQLIAAHVARESRIAFLVRDDHGAPKSLSRRARLGTSLAPSDNYQSAILFINTDVTWASSGVSAEFIYSRTRGAPESSRWTISCSASGVFATRTIAKPESCGPFKNSLRAPRYRFARETVPKTDSKSPALERAQTRGPQRARAGGQWARRK